jgi:hypothetical protein
VREARGNVLQLFSCTFQGIGGSAFRLFRAQVQIVPVAIPRWRALRLAAQFMSFLVNQHGRHQQQAGISHLPHRCQHFARLFIDMGGKFLEMGFFAVITRDGVSAAIYHDID